MNDSHDSALSPNGTSSRDLHRTFYLKIASTSPVTKSCFTVLSPSQCHINLKLPALFTCFSLYHDCLPGEYEFHRYRPCVSVGWKKCWKHGNILGNILERERIVAQNVKPQLGTPVSHFREPSGKFNIYTLSGLLLTHILRQWMSAQVFASFTLICWWDLDETAGKGNSLFFSPGLLLSFCLSLSHFQIDKKKSTWKHQINAWIIYVWVRMFYSLVFNSCITYSIIFSLDHEWWIWIGKISRANLPMTSVMVINVVYT